MATNNNPIKTAAAPSVFDKALKLILQFEGGNDDDPRDPGGRTGQGILQSEYDTWRAKRGLPHKDVFTMPDAERDQIYKERYWNVGYGGNPAPAAVANPALAITLFDTGVNPRVGIWTKVKAILADKTLTPQQQAEKIITAREASYRQRVVERPDQRVFLNGWLNRMKTLRSYIGALGATANPPKPTPQPVKVAASAAVKPAAVAAAGAVAKSSPGPVKSQPPQPKAAPSRA